VSILNKDNWWQNCDKEIQQILSDIWISIGNPGYTGNRKLIRRDYFDTIFGEDCWRESHIVRGRIVSKSEALREYEQSYRTYLHNHPHVVNFLVKYCGNVYDYQVENVLDSDYEQPHTSQNHFQDITIRRIISELVDEPDWSNIIETKPGEVKLIDLTTGQTYRVERARGFRGKYLLQIRGPKSPGFFLSPAVIPVHDPMLLVPNSQVTSWFSKEGCGHMSIEAFWQNSKVIEVRYDKFLQLENKRLNPFGSLDNTEPTDVLYRNHVNNS
jgi:hypothetical protein